MTAIIDPGNRRSIRVATKLGMQASWETTFHDTYVVVYEIANPAGGRKGPL